MFAPTRAVSTDDIFKTLGPQAESATNATDEKEPDANAPSSPPLTPDSSNTSYLYDTSMWSRVSTASLTPEPRDSSSINQHSHPRLGKRAMTVSNLESRRQQQSPRLQLRRQNTAPIRPESVGKIITDVLPELHHGMSLLRYPHRKSTPHFRFVQLSSDNSYVQWYSKSKRLEVTRIAIANVVDILEGQQTETFAQYPDTKIGKASFSVVYDGDVTFDVAAKSTHEAKVWILALRSLVEKAKNGEDVSQLGGLDVGIFPDRKRIHRVTQKDEPEAKSVAEMQGEMRKLQKKYDGVVTAMNRPVVRNCDEFDNIEAFVSDLQTRIEMLSEQVQRTPDSKITRRDYWRVDVDVTAISEKVAVLAKYLR